MNAPLVAGGINAYASALSLGTSVVEYLHIPPYNAADSNHPALAELAKKLTHAGEGPTDAQWDALDWLTAAIVDVGADVLEELHTEGEDVTEAVGIAMA